MNANNATSFYQMIKQHSRYSPSFYAKVKDGSAESADTVLPLVFSIVHPRSVLDVGCGVGTWLNSAQKLGITDVVGIDGSWVQRSDLQIKADRFVAKDLSLPFDLCRRFDLVMSLEVAEHISENSAVGFIESLTRHGDVVLFSAAIPAQGGTNHVNEQWPNYWFSIFEMFGYKSFDCIRARIWRDERVSSCYAQNVFLLANDPGLNRCPEIIAASQHTASIPLPVVHPRTLHEARQPGVKTAANMMINAVMRRIRQQLNTK